MFGTVDDELLLFIDRKNDLEIFVREISVDTNFNAESVSTESQLKAFAQRALFPSHALILRKSKNDFTGITKGISDWPTLLDWFRNLIQTYGEAYVETDMRAMYNPTRLQVIEKAAHKLVKKIRSCCPQCNIPGFGITDRKEGLPCSLCGLPTRSTLAFVYCCQKCGFEKEEVYPNNITQEDPSFCNRCNP